MQRIVLVGDSGTRHDSIPASNCAHIVINRTDRTGHVFLIAIDSIIFMMELCWGLCLQLIKGIEITVKWYRDSLEWMDEVTSRENVSIIPSRTIISLF